MLELLPIKIKINIYKWYNYLKKIGYTIVKIYNKKLGMVGYNNLFKKLGNIK